MYAQIFNFLVTTGSGFLDNPIKFLFVSQEVLGNVKLPRMQVGVAFQDFPCTIGLKLWLSDYEGANHHLPHNSACLV